MTQVKKYDFKSFLHLTYLLSSSYSVLSSKNSILYEISIKERQREKNKKEINKKNNNTILLYKSYKMIKRRKLWI